MANEDYESAGIEPIDTEDSPTANTYYISAGLTPDDEVGTSSLTMAYRFG